MILEKNQKKYSNSIFKFKILISITILVFIMRNFDRINNEIKKYDYNPIQYSFYYIDKSHFRIQSNFDYLITNFNNCKINLSTCDKTLRKKSKSFTLVDICLFMIKFLTLNLLKYFDFLNQSKVFKFLKKKRIQKI